ncbi:MAG TPA: hypothetical protein VHW67_03650 [Solirubrobacteraceae bacterium]|nr:hypothetical protein [Solirubrobacteraceae bacterium]
MHIRDALPPGLTATSISGPSCSLAQLECEFKSTIAPYQMVTETISVSVNEPLGTVTSLPQTVTVEGGATPSLTRTLSVPVSGSPPEYGVSTFEAQLLNEDATPAAQAGSHPFQFTTTLTVNRSASGEPIALPKDFTFHLPPGLLGNPNAAKQCSMVDFFALVEEANLCSPESVVGVATVEIMEPKLGGQLAFTIPVFNLVPAQGEPARLGFEALGKVPIVLDTSVRSGGDYGVDVSVRNATQTAGLLIGQVTIWGVPGDPRHDAARGWECVSGGKYARQIGKPCPAEPKLPQTPFLSLPTSCAATPAAEPASFSMSSDSWLNPGAPVGSEYAWADQDGNALGFDGCSQLPFSPSVTATPEQHTASTPSGVSIDVHVPQPGLSEAEGLATADIRDTTVTLPAGVQLSPSAANGLVGCSEGQAGFEGFDASTQMQRFDGEEASCPDASKLGLLHIKTPLLEHELAGALYLAEPAPNGEAGKNPFGSLVAVYLVARDPVSGVLVKLAGEGVLDEGTLRVATTFREAPEVPFEDLKVDLFGGPRASLSTPAKCGGYATDGVFTPWSGMGPLAVQAPGEDFQISSGIGGSACPGGALGFTPGFTALSTNPQAGAYTGFSLELTRPDGDQALGGLSMHLPPGVAAMLSSVTLCSDAQASASACPADSEVGHATAIAGLGPEPIVQEGGRVYITGPYGNAPFGLEIVTPAKAGPFDLGFVTVRSKLYIDPNDASVTIVSDPLPTQIRGIPLQLKRVLVSVDRPNFQFNPTSCAPMSIAGTLSGAEGASVPVSQRFQVGACENLPFGPTLSASAAGRASKANGTSFTVTVRSQGLGQANIAKVVLALPKQLPSRLTTLQKACIEAAFNANPASCSPESVIGTATIHTPVLKSPLSGPAYLVSHGNAAFPDVEFVLQGEGITLILDGKTDIKAGITYSRFESAPDAPFSTFETVLPAGPHSVLTANVAQSKQFNLCGEKLTMPTEITAQNGAKITTTTNVGLTGCSAVKASKAKKLTRAQKLKRALKACRKKFKAKRLKAKRAGCEAQARKQYGPKQKAHPHKGKKSPSGVHAVRHGQD